ncbi:MAG: bifunctional nuclease family protein [Anaerolineales bacterium]|jgi:bifunctional DNase/RNase|uniref:bifunctional nuclease family protein n=1 Tax=Candidatus Villigracilis proximus TaxID=3140683 RepID=UPI003134942D|nr:bifunctional nuclease family protein [Anaerolineales bacterium]MBK9207180.1 bifunctional nuclease family protein [Anaerolineales bacterium]
MSDMIEVIIDSIRVHLMTPQRVVVLKQVTTERYLTIWVGPYEAEAITVALQEVEMARPLTHALLKNIFSAFNARITRVEIIRLQDDVFFGNIVAEADGREVIIDSRPSDAIAIAVRAHVPIFVHESVMETAGMMPDQDMPDTTTAAPAKKAPPVPLTDEGNDRLSVFKDFIDKLDIDNPDKDKPESPLT